MDDTWPSTGAQLRLGDFLQGLGRRGWRETEQRSSLVSAGDGASKRLDDCHSLVDEFGIVPNILNI